MKLTDNEFELITKAIALAEMQNNWDIQSTDQDEDVFVDFQQDIILSLEQGILEFFSQAEKILKEKLSKEEFWNIQKLTIRAKTSQALDKSRLEALLFNAITLLEDCILGGKTLLGTEILDELNMRDEEYRYILGEGNNKGEFAEGRKTFGT